MTQQPNTQITADSTSSYKQHLRQQARSRRRSLSPQQQQLAALRMARRVAGLAYFKRAQHIAFYMASDGEISVERLLIKALNAGKNCYLPRIVGKNIEFRRYHKNWKMPLNRYGIAEPNKAAQHIAAHQLDLVCLPLVGFDSQGHRLGMGGGFYDRCFHFKRSKIKAKPILIGIAHGVQKLPAVPTESWDIPLEIIASDNELIGRSSKLI